MFNVRLAGDHLYGKWLLTWLSLVMSSFLLSFFSRDVELDSSHCSKMRDITKTSTIFQY